MASRIRSTITFTTSPGHDQRKPLSMLHEPSAHAGQSVRQRGHGRPLPALVAVGLALAAISCANQDTDQTRTPRISLVPVAENGGLPETGKTSGLVLCDLNQDQLPDILLGRHSGTIEAYVNRGSLHFEKLPEWSNKLDIADHHATVAADFDGDGCADFYFIVGAKRGQGLGPNALHLCADGYRSDVAEEWGVEDPHGRGRSGLVLDIEGDGTRELLVLNYKTPLGVFPLGDETSPQELGTRADPLLTMSFGASDWIHHLIPADFDLDGLLDFVAFGGPPVLLYQGTAKGPQAMPHLLPPDAYVPPPVTGAVADFNGDDYPDLYLVYGENDAGREFDRPRHNRLLLWKGDCFEEAPLDPVLALGGHGVAAQAADLDGDGWQDLVVVQADRGAGIVKTRILLNRGGARFVEVTDDVGADTEYRGYPDGLAVSDLDRDGDLDLLIVLGAIGEGRIVGGVALMRNEGRRPWVALEITDDGGAPAYGATVVLEQGRRRRGGQYRPTQVGGSSFAWGLHFSLPVDGTIDEIVVRWPGGRERSLRAVLTGRVIRISADAE